VEVVEAPSPGNFGLVYGVVIAVILSWLAVPNAVVPDPSTETHLRLTLASVLAAAVWTYNLSGRAMRAPGNAAIRLSIAVYLTGLLTSALVGVPMILPNPDAPTPTSAIGFVLSPLPWIVAGSAAWAYGMRFGWPVLTATYPHSIRARFNLSKTESNREGRIFAVAVVLLLAIGTVGIPDVRHLGWDVPSKPAAHRPDVVGVVTLVDKSAANGDVVVSLSQGGTLRLPARSALGAKEVRQGDLVAAARDPSAWWDTLPETFNGGEYLSSTFAWDQGDAILFPDGLELKKAEDLTKRNPSPTAAFGDKVFTLGKCAQIHVNPAGEVTWTQVCG
jgi:hypothetical protein